MNRLILILALLIITFVPEMPLLARDVLIKDVSQLATNATHPNALYNDLNHLLDESSETVFLTNPEYTAEQHYLTVSLSNGIEMEAAENLYVVLTRTGRLYKDVPTKNNPTAMEIHYTFVDKGTDGTAWNNENVWEKDVMARVYFINRGSHTTEISDALPFSDLASRIKSISGLTCSDEEALKKVKGLKFIVTMNNGRNIVGSNVRPMVLGGFQLVTAEKGEKIVGNWIDRFHLDTDINRRFESYTFSNSQGPLEVKNRYRDGKGVLVWGDGLDQFDKEGKWTADAKLLADNNIDMPDYSWLTYVDDSRIKPGVKLQRTNTVEHVLYAVQGDPISLYPFYTLYPQNDVNKHPASKYDQNFIHWYDYTTGGHVSDDKHNELLGFIADPSQVLHTESYGWFAGNEIRISDEPCTPDAPKVPIEYGTYATFFHPRDPFSEDGNMRPLCKEFVIAADMAQDFWDYDNGTYGNTDYIKKTITEPTIQFRHLFIIKDGKKFADENMATYEGNQNFIKKNQRRVTAPANKDFQIRLDFPYPVEKTTRGVFYYKINDADYRRICSRIIRVYKVDDKTETLIQDENTPEAEKMFKPCDASKFDGQGSRTVDGVNYYICGGGGHFFRMIECKAGKATAGKYKIQIVGTDYDGEIIKLCDDPQGRPLLVQQYEIEFLGQGKSLMVAEEDLKKSNDDNQKGYDNQIGAYLDENFGTPFKIDYDQYRVLQSDVNPQIDQTKQNWYLQKETIDGHDYHYFKWPLPWDDCNYGFGYNQRHDYGMYMIANNALITSHKAAPFPDYEFNEAGDKGLFDRRYYDTNGQERGYFYYVNAASDPGVIAKFNLGTFCYGTAIHISCWVAELNNYDETANLAFNFVARMEDGERIPIHTHVTGYVGRENYGKWMYVYATFTPEINDKGFTNGKRLSHYELEIDNNCSNSWGADYAIDDIRVYTSRPVIDAEQISSLCQASSANNNTNIDVRVSVGFDELLKRMGVTAVSDNPSTENQGELINLYYAFLDKDKYDAALANDENNRVDAFNAAVLNVIKDNGGNNSYPMLQFRTCWEDNPNLNDNPSANDKALKWKDSYGKKMIALNTKISDPTLQSGKQYYVAVAARLSNSNFGYSDSGEEKTEPDALTFKVEEDCGMKTTLAVRTPNLVKIDGEVKNQSEEIDACRNQSPVVQVDLYAQKNDGKVFLVEENAVFDWFDGSMAEFINIKNGETSLWDAMFYFRENYPHASNLSDGPKESYTKEMQDLIRQYVEIDPEGKRHRLYLAQSSYVYPPLVLEDNSDKKDAYVLALPIPKLYDDKDGKYVVCTQPTEVHVVVRQSAPYLAHGIKRLSYPKPMHDVSLRISLEQTEKVTGSKKTASQKSLVLPIRAVTPASAGVTQMKTAQGAPIFLAATNDPEYKNLAPTSGDEDGLWEIGTVNSLLAHSSASGVDDANDASDVSNDDKVNLRFYKDIDFKEGYWYTMRYMFEEVAPEGADANDVCIGHAVFTLKIVPEYQKWTGKINKNWNNDGNWSRVSSTELKLPSITDDITGHVTDGSNNRSFSYAPLDFTKTIIPGNSDNVPELFKATVDGEIANWDSNADFDAAGKATDYVVYDMVQDVKDDAIYCRPWQANFCDQIHFEPGSEIGHQQHLNYKKAWVDFETAPDRWYTLASPLQGVVAGDMYLPTDGARQETPYFKDITFDIANNNRFKPAVYQRSWNKGEAIVYKYDSSNSNDNDENTNTTSNAHIEANWSNVYNDVKVPYSRGEGFSIKTDVAGVSGFSSSESSDNSASSDKKVLFRLPKADTSYTYYSESGSQSGNTTSIASERLYRLNEVTDKFESTLTSATKDNRFFLVGNPFMAHMDIAKFLKENSSVINPKYWILEGNKQGAAIMGDAQIMSTFDNPEYIAPMQGFFVEKKKEDGKDYDGTTLTLTFSPEMAATVNDKPAPKDVLTRNGDASSSMYGVLITAKGSGSSALIAFDGSARSAYCESEDAMFVADESLEASPLVYTMAEGTATTVNVLPEIVSTEIGVIDDEEGKTTLVFEGVDSSMGLMLYDCGDDSYTLLYDGMEKTIDGSPSHRLFIVNSRAQIIEPSLDIVLMANGVRIISSNDSLTANIYDLDGRLVRQANGSGNDLFIPLSAGIYIVEASDAVQRKSQKIMISK